MTLRTEAFLLRSRPCRSLGDAKLYKRSDPPRVFTSSSIPSRVTPLPLTSKRLSTNEKRHTSCDLRFLISSSYLVHALFSPPAGSSTSRKVPKTTLDNSTRLSFINSTIFSQTPPTISTSPRIFSVTSIITPQTSTPKPYPKSAASLKFSSLKSTTFCDHYTISRRTHQQIEGQTHGDAATRMTKMVSRKLSVRTRSPLAKWS